jgi:hypothetical protein
MASRHLSLRSHSKNMDLLSSLSPPASREETSNYRLLADMKKKPMHL